MPNESNSIAIIETINEESWEHAKLFANKIADYLETKIPSGFIRVVSKRAIDGWLIMFGKKHSNVHYRISVHPDYLGNVKLDFYEETILSSESLADPSLNYENTSAKLVKLKKKRLRRNFDNEKKTLKAIDTFFMKY